MHRTVILLFFKFKRCRTSENINDFSHLGPLIADAPAPPQPVPPSYIPLDFDLLVQTATSVPSTLVGEKSSSLLASCPNVLVTLNEPPATHSLAVNKTPSQDGDVSMLDTGASTATDIVAGANDDVQLLHSPPSDNPPLVPSTAVAPSLADVFLKFEDIKPSMKFTLRKLSKRLSLILYYIKKKTGPKTPYSLLSQESGLNVNLHSASANLPKVS